MYKSGLIIGIKLNLNKINNNFDFNLVNYRHTKKALKNETFIWTVDNKETLKKVLKDQNVITDKSKEIYEIINDEK